MGSAATSMTATRAVSTIRAFRLTLRRDLRRRDSWRILASEAAQSVGDGLPEVGEGSRFAGAQRLGEGHFDEIEVGIAKGQAGSGRLDRLTYRCP
jgi:hypothetical protein